MGTKNNEKKNSSNRRLDVVVRFFSNLFKRKYYYRLIDPQIPIPVFPARWEIEKVGSYLDERDFMNLNGKEIKEILLKKMHDILLERMTIDITDNGKSKTYQASFYIAKNPNKKI